MGLASSHGEGDREHRSSGASRGQSKITNLQLTILVQQEIAGLQITMEDARRMQVLQPSKDLQTRKKMGKRATIRGGVVRGVTKLL